MIITLESITEKLGFNPLTYQYSNGTEDDRNPNPLKGLTIEECDFLIELAKNTPECYS